MNEAEVTRLLDIAISTKNEAEEAERNSNLKVAIELYKRATSELVPVLKQEGLAQSTHSVVSSTINKYLKKAENCKALDTLYELESIIMDFQMGDVSKPETLLKIKDKMSIVRPIMGSMSDDTKIQFKRIHEMVQKVQIQLPQMSTSIPDTPHIAEFVKDLPSTPIPKIVESVSHPPVPKAVPASPVPSSNSVSFTDLELDVIRVSSKIDNGTIDLPPFDLSIDPIASKRLAEEGTPLSYREALLPLSQKQSQELHAWYHASHVLPLLGAMSRLPLPPPSPASLPGVPPPRIVCPSDLSPSLILQRSVGDCGIISAISICCGYEFRFPNRTPILTSNIYPHDANGRPIVSKTGRYVVKLWLNGMWRAITIDDRIPISKNGTPIGAYCRNGDLWVSLIEKAALKVRGGFEHPGSQAHLDILMLTGWLPEHNNLTSIVGKKEKEDRLWNRLHGGMSCGDFLCCASSRILTEEMQESTGLVNLHAYSVLEVLEFDSKTALERPNKGDVKLVLLRNPWGSGRWKGGYSTGRKDTWCSDILYQKLIGKYTDFEADGLFWMEYPDFLSYFTQLYMCVNPNLMLGGSITRFMRINTNMINNFIKLHGQTFPLRIPQLLVKIPRHATSSGIIWMVLDVHDRFNYSERERRRDTEGIPQGKILVLSPPFPLVSSMADFRVSDLSSSSKSDSKGRIILDESESYDTTSFLQISILPGNSPAIFVLFPQIASLIPISSDTFKPDLNLSTLPTNNTPVNYSLSLHSSLPGLEVVPVPETLKFTKEILMQDNKGIPQLPQGGNVSEDFFFLNQQYLLTIQVNNPNGSIIPFAHLVISAKYPNFNPIPPCAVALCSPPSSNSHAAGVSPFKWLKYPKVLLNGAYSASGLGYARTLLLFNQQQLSQNPVSVESNNCTYLVDETVPSCNNQATIHISTPPSSSNPNVVSKEAGTFIRFVVIPWVYRDSTSLNSQHFFLDSNNNLGGVEVQCSLPFTFEPIL